MHTMPLLSASDLTLSLPDRASQKLLGAATTVDILKGVDLDLEPGESVGIVGESGSGKTSLGRTLLRLYEPTAGRLMFDGQDITHLREDQLRPLRDKIQMIFQDPQSATPYRRHPGATSAGLCASSRQAGRQAGRSSTAGARALTVRVRPTLPARAFRRAATARWHCACLGTRTEADRGR